jgi:hypothetical protein
MWWTTPSWSSTFGVFVPVCWLCPLALFSDGRGMAREDSMGVL